MNHKQTVLTQRAVFCMQKSAQRIARKTSYMLFYGNFRGLPKSVIRRQIATWNYSTFPSGGIYMTGYGSAGFQASGERAAGGQG